ncbi:MAG: hypothetical protein RL701_3527 [Pseudomonadota bacterium]|jgi:hypothetical protein
MRGTCLATVVVKLGARQLVARRGVDQDYLDKSGDTTVRLKQHLSETVADMHELLGDLDRMMRALYGGFHALVPPLEEPITAHKEMLARRKASGDRR